MPKTKSSKSVSANDVQRFQISEDLQLVVTRRASNTTAKPPATHHIACLDCSGSMSGDLPRLREQLKNKLASLLGPEDTFSAVWFSGKREFGVMLENEPVAGLKELSNVQKAVDRWLKPIGLTGFVEPLTEVAALIDRVNKKTPGMAHSLFFMSDGCDNQWARHEILSAVTKLSTRVQAATFVEYGYYADKQLLAEMAAKCSGKTVFADHFPTYEPAFESAMREHGAPRVPVTIEGEVIGGVAFALDSRVPHAEQGRGDVVQLEVGRLDGKGIVMAPEHLDAVFHLAPGNGGTPLGAVLRSKMGRPSYPDADAVAARNNDALYAALSVFATRGMPDVILPILRALGDKFFVKKYTGLFGKQAYSAFQVETARAAFDESARLREGFDPNAVPSDDAFTVMDMLTMLSADDSARILFEAPEFRYSRIGRKRIDAHDEAETGVEALKFVRVPQHDGTSANALVFNEDRANVSVNVKHEGHVDLSGRLPPGSTSNAVPMKFPTFQYRSYTIVKDGLVNVSRLPLLLPRKMFDDVIIGQRVPHSLMPNDRPGLVGVVVHLDEMPIIDRRDVKELSAVALLDLQWKLEKSRCKQKVFKHYRDEAVTEKKDVAFAAKYGDEAAEWLKKNGFDSYKGYAPPHTKQAPPSGDYYLAKVFEVNIPTFGSLPSVKDAAAGKGSTAGRVMQEFINECEEKKTAYGKTFPQWIEAAAKQAIVETRALISEVARQKFAVIISQRWFPEFQTIGEGTLPLPLLSVRYGAKKTPDVSFVMKEEKVLL